MASFEETSKTLEGSEKLQYPLHESQSISKFWNTLEETALEKAENALIQERHVSVQRRLEVDDGDNSRRGPGRNFKKLFQAISRKVGKLSSIKQYIVERHLILYGSDTKKKVAESTGANGEISNTSNFRSNKAPPVNGMVVPVDHKKIELDSYTKHLYFARNGFKCEKSIWIHGKQSIGTEELLRRLAAKKGIPLVSPAS